MSRSASILALAALAGGSVAFAQQPGVPAASVQGSSDSQKVCQYVVDAGQGKTPYKLCLTKDEWAAKKLADERDANRIVCHYEQDPATRFRSAKVCMPQSAWDEARRLDREAVEGVHRSVCVSGGGC